MARSDPLDSSFASLTLTQLGSEEPGILVECPEDIEALADSVQKLLDNSDLAQEGICIRPHPDNANDGDTTTTEQTALALIASLMTLHGHAQEPPLSIKVYPFSLMNVLVDPLFTW